MIIRQNEVGMSSSIPRLIPLADNCQKLSGTHFIRLRQLQNPIGWEKYVEFYHGRVFNHDRCLGNRSIKI